MLPRGADEDAGEIIVPFSRQAVEKLPELEPLTIHGIPAKLDVLCLPKCAAACW